jgi:septum site-determining protein MinC
MNSDSAIPDLEQNSALPDAESTSKLTDVKVNNSTVADADSQGIIPKGELDSVLRYLADSTSENGESNSTKSDIKPNSEPPDLNTTDLASPEKKLNQNIQVQLKTEDGKLLLILPTEAQIPASDVSWSEIWQQIKYRLNAGDRLRVANTTVHLIAKDRLLDSRQLQNLGEALNGVQLQLKSVATSRRQTAIAAVTSGYSVEQLQPETSLNSDSKPNLSPLADALYLEMTVRSGVEIRHPGTVIILGDINPGGIVIAEGDILVWGRLRGIAHAGAGGNRDCLIMALQMEPTQLRIADAVARAPEKNPMHLFPEVAYITIAGIRITRATDFSRNQFNRMNQEL